MNNIIRQIFFIDDFKVDFSAALYKLNSALISKEFLEEYFKHLGVYEKSVFDENIDTFIEKLLINTEENKFLASPISLSKIEKITTSNKNMLFEFLSGNISLIGQFPFVFFSFQCIKNNYALHIDSNNAHDYIVVNNDCFFSYISNSAAYSISSSDADDLAIDFSDYTTVSKKDTVSYFYEIMVQVLRVFCMSDGTVDDRENYKK